MATYAGLMLVKSDSTRLPNKNTLDFNGSQMFLVNLEKCMRVFDDVYVSSDSDKILQMAKRYGVGCIKRPKELCGDTPNIPVYQHAYLEMNNPTYVVAVQANSPTLEQQTIEDVVDILKIGFNEVMTCHEDGSVYGSVWALRGDRIMAYKDPYNPTFEVLVVDPSIDIHTEEDYKKALCQ